MYNLIGVGEDALRQLTNKLRIDKIDSREVTTRLWYVVCALRGPDSDDHELKVKYTGPIRAWVSQDWNLAIGSTTHSKVLTLMEFTILREEVIKRLEYADYDTLRSDKKVLDAHYLSHIRLALNVIINYERYRAHEKVTS